MPHQNKIQQRTPEEENKKAAPEQQLSPEQPSFGVPNSLARAVAMTPPPGTPNSVMREMDPEDSGALFRSRGFNPSVGAHELSHTVRRESGSAAVSQTVPAGTIQRNPEDDKKTSKPPTVGGAARAAADPAAAAAAEPETTGPAAAAAGPTAAASSPLFSAADDEEIDIMQASFLERARTSYDYCQETVTTEFVREAVEAMRYLAEYRGGEWVQIYRQYANGRVTFKDMKNNEWHVDLVSLLPPVANYLSRCSRNRGYQNSSDNAKTSSYLSILKNFIAKGTEALSLAHGHLADWQFEQVQDPGMTWEEYLEMQKRAQEEFNNRAAAADKYTMDMSKIKKAMDTHEASAQHRQPGFWDRVGDGFRMMLGKKPKHKGDEDDEGR